MGTTGGVILYSNSLGPPPKFGIGAKGDVAGGISCINSFLAALFLS